MKIQKVEEKLQQHLVDLISISRGNQHKSSTCDYKSIRYVHTKYPYEVEVPEQHQFWKDIQRIDPLAADVTSSRSGFVRFRTSKIIDSGKLNQFGQAGNRATVARTLEANILVSLLS